MIFLRYFKPEYLADMQSSESTEEADRLWEDSIAEYVDQLESLQPKLSARNYSFFRYHSLHDGCVVEMRVIDRNAAKMRAEGRYHINPMLRSPAVVEIEVLAGEFVYMLTFSKVSRLIIKSPTEDTMPGWGGFGDWGYDELTEVGDRIFRYEVLFISGTTLLIEFAGFRYKRQKFIG